MGLSNNGAYGTFTLTGSAAQIESTVASGNSVIFKALTTNAGTIYLGTDNSVTSSNGLPLDPGDAISLDFGSPTKFWINGTSGYKVAWMVVGS